MKHLITGSLILFLAQQASPSLPEARRKAGLEILKLKDAMAKAGAKAEMGDCDSILQKMMAPDKPMADKGGSAPYPGDKEYDAIVTAWAEMGTAVALLLRDGSVALKDPELEATQTLAGWFAAFPEFAKGIRHLNRRRKFCKLPPVTLDWSGTIGGYFHDVYLVKNKDHPSVKGLGAHNEDGSLPGATPEGAAAAGGILGWGSSTSVVDMWMGSRFHRDPVFYNSCGRVAFGGRPGGCFSCKSAGGATGRSLAKVITWPGDGDTDIPTTFGGELPDPFPPGVKFTGTLIVVEGWSGKMAAKISGPDGKEIPTLTLDRTCFAPKEALQAKTLYKVELAGPKDALTWTFTTK